MNNKTIILTGFALLALVQLAVPAKMIYNREVILNEGKTYRFKTMPVDPYDAMRGKYLTLDFHISNLIVGKDLGFKSGENIFLKIGTDSNGIAVVKAVYRTRPKGQDYIKAQIAEYYKEPIMENDKDANYKEPTDVISYKHHLRVELPFNRFYMEESLALPAEQAYAESMQRPEQVTVALVSILNGEAVLKDIQINGVAIREIARRNIDRQIYDTTTVEEADTMPVP